MSNDESDTHGPRIAAGLFGLLLGLAVFACGASPTDDRPVLDGSVGSPEEVAREVLEAFSEQDTARLNRIRLTEREHNELVWPEQPASRPEANFPVDYAWKNIQTRNYAALERLLRLYGGKQLAYTGVECRGETREFESFEALMDCWVSFTVDGESWGPRQLFKHVIAWKATGEHKIVRYYEP